MIYVPDGVSGEVVGAVSICDEDEAMIITSTGKTIKIEADTVRILGKNARGVRIVNIAPPDLVIGLDRVVNEGDEAVLAGTSELSEGVEVEGSIAIPADEATDSGSESGAEPAADADEDADMKAPDEEEV